MKRDDNIIKINKSIFREKCFKKLNFCSNNGKIKKDKIICARLLELILLYRPKKILVYIPLATEVNILPLIKEIRKRKLCEVYVPYITGVTFKVVKFRLPLNKKQFGLKEPNNSFLNTKIDLAIVPILGTDSTNRRIGFGKGMYDRFFGSLNYKPLTIFTQLTLCKSKDIITSWYDIKADYIITK